MLLREGEVTLENSIQSVNELRDFYVSQLAEGLTTEEHTEFKSRIWNQFAGARQHIEVIYEAGYALGPNLSGLVDFSHSRNYRTHLENLARRLEDGPDQVKQSGFVASKDEESRAFRNLIAKQSQYIRRR